LPPHAQASFITMDIIISFEEVAGFLCNPPMVAPRPDFSKLRALHQHIINALKQLECPKSFIHGWSSHTMASNVYILLEPIAFTVPVDPGSAPVYIAFAPPATIKMVDAAFECDKNYYLSYKNINCTCFCIINELDPNQLKVSNNPLLTGWNASMYIQDILNQMEDSYVKPSSGALFANGMLFKSPFTKTKAPELLFYRIKQCEEVMTLGKLPNRMERVIKNALCLLMAMNIFPMREFDMWETTMVKTYPALKTFINKAYLRHLNSMELQNTSSTLGYTAPTHNMYNMLRNGDNDDDSVTDITVATIAGAATTGSTMRQGMAAESIHPSNQQEYCPRLQPSRPKPNCATKPDCDYVDGAATTNAAPPQPSSMWHHLSPMLLSLCNIHSRPRCSGNNTNKQRGTGRASKANTTADRVVRVVVDVAAVAVIMLTAWL
jgi:hypothetical protein